MTRREAGIRDGLRRGRKTVRARPPGTGFGAVTGTQDSASGRASDASAHQRPAELLSEPRASPALLRPPRIRARAAFPAPGPRRRPRTHPLHAAPPQARHMGRPRPQAQGHSPGENGVVDLSPGEFLDRLADLVPPPRRHRHRYHGVCAPNHPLRRAVTALAIGNLATRADAASCSRLPPQPAPTRTPNSSTGRPLPLASGSAVDRPILSPTRGEPPLRSWGREPRLPGVFSSRNSQA
jgi:hypothetical protein